MIHVAAVDEDLDAETAYRLDMLARLVRNAPRFGDAVTWWAGFELRWKRRAPDRRQGLDEDDAHLLDLPVGTEVLRRELDVVAQIGQRTTFRAASTIALVHLPSCGLTAEQRTALYGGAVPIGRILADARRTTIYTYRVGGSPTSEQPALRAQATLNRGGRPVALCRESVTWALLQHRTPGWLPHYVPAVPGTTW